MNEFTSTKNIEKPKEIEKEVAKPKEEAPLKIRPAMPSLKLMPPTLPKFEDEHFVRNMNKQEEVVKQPIAQPKQETQQPRQVIQQQQQRREAPPVRREPASPMNPMPRQ